MIKRSFRGTARKEEYRRPAVQYTNKKSSEVQAEEHIVIFILDSDLEKTNSMNSAEFNFFWDFHSL